MAGHLAMAATDRSLTVAADVEDKKLQQANALGADDVVNNRNASEAAERYRRSRVRAGC